MTALSTFGARIALDSGELVEEDGADVSLMRTLENNAQHFADQSAQVRVNMSGPANPLTTKQIGAGDVDTWLPIAVFGPFPLRVRADGNPYLIRARIGGSASAANSITLRAALAPVLGAATGRGSEYIRGHIEDNGVNVLEASTSSTSAAWLTATGSRTTLDATGLVIESQFTLATVSAAGGAVRDVSVRAAMFGLHVWGLSTTSGTQPQLDALYAAEFVG